MRAIKIEGYLIPVLLQLKVPITTHLWSIPTIIKNMKKILRKV